MMRWILEKTGILAALHGEMRQIFKEELIAEDKAAHEDWKRKRGML